MKKYRRKKRSPTESDVLGGYEKKPRRARSAFLVRHILASDDHAFIGRIFELAVIGMHFDTYEELAKHADCKYAFDVSLDVNILVRRVESLNLVGGLLWPEDLPKSFKKFPVSRYEWLTISADVMLMRYISVLDCAIALVSAIYELGLESQKCTIDNLVKGGVPSRIIQILKNIRTDQGKLRYERNSRFHHGLERTFTQDDETFRMAALFEHRAHGMVGKDRYGRKINISRSFNEGLVELQRDFNKSTRILVDKLDNLYEALGREFERRFGPRIRSSTHGLRVSRR